MKRPGRSRRWLTWAAALALGALSHGAEARTVKIVTAQTLELRNVAEQELVIISSDAPGGVELRVDDDLVRAQRVEFNRTHRTLTLIGAASYRTAKDGQTLKGDNLVVKLGDSSLTGQDVLISDSQIEIRGEEVERVPGQLRARNGYFTPCARCGRTTNDYAFRAERLIVYPGDRLVAYRAQLLIADFPVLYLPVVVLPLNDEDRQPKVQVGRDERDGYTVEADLPFAIGSSVLGTSLLRYYQNRSPSLGGGVELRAYAPFSVVDRADLYALLLPKPFGPNGERREGYDVDLNFGVRGRVALREAVRDLDYSLSVKRQDIGRTEQDPERGVTRTEFTARVEYPLYDATLNYLGRSGPEPTTGIYTPYRKTELILDPKPFTVGDLSADFKVTAGRYTAQSNPASPSAKRQGENITTTRLEEAHELRYGRPLWKGAELNLSNSFVGRYDGTGARTVDLKASAELRQRWAGTNSFSVRQEYQRLEGTSPFAFDALYGRRLNAPLTLSLTTVPVKDTTFTVSYSRDPFLQPEDQVPASIGLRVNRRPVSLDYTVRYNTFLKVLETVDYSVTLADADSGKLKLVPARPAAPATPTEPARPATPAYYTRSSAWPFPRFSLTVSGGYSRVRTLPSKPPYPTGLRPVNVRAVISGDDRSSNFGVTAIYDFDREHPLTSVSTDYTLVSGTDTVLNPLTVSGRETLRLDNPYWSGYTNVTWRNYTFSTSHDLDLDPPEGSKSSGNVTFGVGSREGQATSWRVTYGGPYDLRRGGFTAPALRGELGLSQPGQRLKLTATYNTKGLDQPRSELVNATLDGEWQRGRFAVSGRASYLRRRVGTYPNDIPEDIYNFEPLRVGVALGDLEKPSLYLVAALRQQLKYVDGVRTSPEPIAPVLGFTLDRCCWAMQGEWDPVNKRYRLTIGLPGQFYPLLEGGPEGTSVPLLPFSRPLGR